MNLYINSAKEDWVVDRFINEWNKFNYKQLNSYRINGKLIWLIAPWTWRKIPIKYLNRNKVLCTIHHIDEDKFTDVEKEDFAERDKIVNEYHVISNKTLNQVKEYTSKPITKIPFWVNQNIWFPIEDKEILMEKYNFNNSEFLVGSFQRDTEGSDLISPKLSKGPDQFIEIIESLNKQYENLVVILSGKRRNYIIKNLEEKGINYRYYEMTSFETLNELYNILDLYIVSSRYEGGPQSIVECGITRTPIISTNVGIAEEILNSSSIYDMKTFSNAKPDVEFAFQKVQSLQIPQGFEKFNRLIKGMYEN